MKQLIVRTDEMQHRFDFKKDSNLDITNGMLLIKTDGDEVAGFAIGQWNSYEWREVEDEDKVTIPVESR